MLRISETINDSVDKIVQGNVSNIIFLKSTDDTMIETLSKMSGTTHRVYRDSKTVTKDVEKLMLQTEGKISYTSTAKEEPVISYNDLNYLPERNSIVFRAGDEPIWNRNATILPMSWRLFMNKIEHYGHPDYTLQTIPTLSTAIDFDVRQNQPNFVEMVERRVQEATFAEAAADTFASGYGYTLFDIERLDPDVYANEVVDIIRLMMGEKSYAEQRAQLSEDDEYFEPEDISVDEYEAMSALFDDGYDLDNPDGELENSDMPLSKGQIEAQKRRYQALDKSFSEGASQMAKSSTENVEVENAQFESQEAMKGAQVMRYAGGRISREMLYNPITKQRAMGKVDDVLERAYAECWQHFEGTPGLRTDGQGNLYEGGSSVKLFKFVDQSADVQKLGGSTTDPESRVYAEEGTVDEVSQDEQVHNRFQLTDAGVQYLVGLDKWDKLADGEFDKYVAQEWDRDNETTILDR